MSELNSILYTAGGLGLFLLGMVLMTEYLKKLAANRIRSALFKYTKTPYSGALTGAISTAVVQSSSATTVAAVGFVGAGLMTFSNSLGVVFGANIGTTITGWMVALLGFKFSIDVLALPIIFIGVMMRLFLKRSWSHLGLVLAGFGLIFVGIDTMQLAMQGMRDILDFSQLPANNLIGQLQLLALGLIFTAITQSSSAGVAITLTALFSGVIEFEQAAALVIGMDVGTSVTSLMATIGGSINAKRTGYSHVIYNFLTAILALLLITPYISLWEMVELGSINQHAEIALVAFHTLFNTVGVLLILPFTQHFSKFMKRLVPQSTEEYVKQLDYQLLSMPGMALTAVQITLIELSKALLNELNFLMSRQKPKNFRSNLIQLQQDLDQTQFYLDAVHLSQNEVNLWSRLTSMIHLLDHLQRLHERCEEEDDRAEASKQFIALHKLSNRLEMDINELQNAFKNGMWSEAVEITQSLYNTIHDNAEGYRHGMVERMGQGLVTADECWDALEAIRWMERVSNHLYRISYYLEKMLLESGNLPYTE